MQIREKNYIDITEEIFKARIQEYEIEWQEFFIDNNGNKYDVDGKHVILKANQEEKEMAKILGRTFGGEISLLPVVLYPKGIQTADYIANGQKFDLKQVTGNGKNTLDTAINKKRKQSNNFIFDISKTKMNTEQAISQIDRIYNAKNRTWVNIIILIKDKNVLKVYKRK